jgi:hypothetical protein
MTSRGQPSLSKVVFACFRRRSVRAPDWLQYTQQPFTKLPACCEAAVQTTSEDVQPGAATEAARIKPPPAGDATSRAGCSAFLIHLLLSGRSSGCIQPCSAPLFGHKLQCGASTDPLLLLLCTDLSDGQTAPLQTCQWF